MALTSGTRLGPYEILSALGTGGMGEVYLARDTKLNRDVAIKVLPDLFARDADRVARFRREAQVLAALNHPHIAAIYGFEDAGDAPALVLEFVDGPTLADRIALGPIAIDDALPIARQIAEALEAAHEKGVIHRDLKPANVKLTADGKVKVLDFGLAKILETEASSSSLSMSPTLSVHATYAGVILGTASYMSPEQARGRPVDTRTDLWAFGCVLYEMLAGQKAFDGGDTVSDAVAAVLRAEVNWGALPPSTPDSVRRLLRRCLDRDRARRLNSAAAARVEIEDARAEPERIAPVVGLTPSRTRERVAWGAAVVLLALVAVGAWLHFSRATTELPVLRLDVVTPPTSDPFSFALSPDGRQIVFVATDGGVSKLWLRPLDQTTAQPLAGTEGAGYPFWKPDSRAIGFFADGKLKRLDLGGGTPQVLAEAPVGRGGSWNRDGVIIFAPTNLRAGRIMRVAATGGTPTAVTRPSDVDFQKAPIFLPDGHHFLFFAGPGPPDVQGEYMGSTDAPDTRRLVPAETPAAYAAPGYLLMVSQDALVATPFDPVRGVAAGEPFRIAQTVGSDLSLNTRGAFSVSEAGVLAHRSGRGRRNQLVWMDRSGRATGTLWPPDESTVSYPELSPDGRHVVFGRLVQGKFDLWLLDASRGVASRFTSEPGINVTAVWAPDGSRVVFQSIRNGVGDLFERLTDGSRESTRVLASPETKLPDDWSPDGRLILYHTVRNPSTGSDLWALPIGDTGKPFPVVQTRFDETEGQFSPDGRWLAYQSNESGRAEIYLRPFPGPGGQIAISTVGGTQPRWRRDGKELFYVSESKLMAVSIGLPPAGQTPNIGAPVLLFAARMATGSELHQQYAVAADGQRFMMHVDLDDESTAPITIVQNWQTAIKGR
jgi:Tol biopolymer transport system component